MSNQFYDQLDVLVSKMIERLNGSDSDVKGFLALLFSQAFETLFYGNLIHNFFRNLNPDYLQECGLSSEYVTIIKSKY